MGIASVEERLKRDDYRRLRNLAFYFSVFWIFFDLSYIFAGFLNSTLESDPLVQPMVQGTGIFLTFTLLGSTILEGLEMRAQTRNSAGLERRVEHLTKSIAFYSELLARLNLIITEDNFTFDSIVSVFLSEEIQKKSAYLSLPPIDLKIGRIITIKLDRNLGEVEKIKMLKELVVDLYNMAGNHLVALGGHYMQYTEELVPEFQQEILDMVTADVDAEEASWANKSKSVPDSMG